MRVSACVGNYAEIPYSIPGLEINVYSVEELCYCMRENAFLLDTTLVNENLLKWLEKQCGLRELVKLLYPYVYRKGSLSALAVTIFQYVGLYDQATVREIEQVLKRSAGLSIIEKKKSQVDYLTRKKKFSMALRGYDRLIARWDEQIAKGEPVPAISCLAAIWHNKGVAYTGLMFYEEASECFMRAYELSGDAEYFRAFLVAKRMELPEEEYVSFVADYGDMYEHTLELERDWEAYLEEWERQPEYLMLYNRREIRADGNWQQYHMDSERQSLKLKDSYRNCVAE